MERKKRRLETTKWLRCKKKKNKKSTNSISIESKCKVMCGKKKGALQKLWAHTNPRKTLQRAFIHFKCGEIERLLSTPNNKECRFLQTNRILIPRCIVNEIGYASTIRRYHMTEIAKN